MSFHSQTLFDAEEETQTLLLDNQQDHTFTIDSPTTPLFKRKPKRKHTNTNSCNPRCLTHERMLATVSCSYHPSHDPKDWLQMYEDVARANNWSSRAKLDILPMYLVRGNANTPRAWFQENQHMWEDYDGDGGEEGKEDGEEEFEAFRIAFLEKYESDSAKGQIFIAIESWRSIIVPFGVTFLIIIFALLFVRAIQLLSKH